METTTILAALVSFEIRQIFQDIVFVGICGVVSVIGLTANIINLVVFVKQGFKDTINISLCGLTLADLACVTTMLWSCICINPLMVRSGQPFASVDFMYLTGSWPHVCFNRITSFITGFITLERCLCVTTPLKVKNIMTPFRTKVIIVAIFIIMFIIFSPTYYVNKLEWRYNQLLNHTVLSLAFTEDRTNVETVTFFIHSVAMSTLSLLTVLVCSIVLVIQLNYKSKWRQTTAAQTKPEAISMKDKRVVKMVSLISIIFFICFLPSTVVFFVMAYDPAFNFGGEYENCFVSVWSMGLLLETISSSINIVIYFQMSSKFRAVFIKLFCAHFAIKE